ncbi:MAG: hypothetical protein KDC44_08080 [Phaeodactylibacter sp.]|nr:hypothetical protein [Phaeodactylibacter sp.]
MRRLLVLVIWMGCLGMAFGQSSAFGVKGGLTVGIQQWNNIDQDPLFKYHGILFIESYDEEENLSSVFAQVGYHIKGSALRNTRFNLQNGNIYSLPTKEFQFRNISLTLGAKKKFQLGAGSARHYYLIGIRGDYTVNTNLSDYEDANQVFFSFLRSDNWVQKFTYGVTAGGGMEFPFSDYVGGVLEFTVNPDLSRQYRQPPLTVTDPYNFPNTRNLGERLINNITLEVTLGIRFLRVVEYID